MDVVAYSYPKTRVYRTCPISISHLTAHKKAALAALLEAYRAAVNFYVHSLWRAPGGLNNKTLARMTRPTRLSESYKNAALRRAILLIAATRKTARATGTVAGEPAFSGAAAFDAKFVKVEAARDLKDFDLVVTLSALTEAKRIANGPKSKEFPKGEYRYAGDLKIPVKATTPLRELLARPGARLIQGANVSMDRITLLVELPDVEPPLSELDPLGPSKCVLGVDVGFDVLLATDRGQLVEDEFRYLAAKVRRKKPGSAAKKRALRERDQAIGRAVNQLPWGTFDAVGVENLAGIKHGSRSGQSKSWRRTRAPWRATAVTARIRRRAEDHAVRVVAVDPKDTSRTCPACGHVDKKSRVESVFLCTKCKYTNHADVVGGINVKTKAECALQEERVFGPKELRGGAPSVVKKTKRPNRSSGLRQKSVRRSPVLGVVMVVASPLENARVDRVQPLRATKNGPRDAGQTRSGAPDSRRPRERVDVAGRGRRSDDSSAVQASGVLRNVESLGRRKPPGETRRGE